MHALAFADYVPISIEECGLYSGAADIYRERARFIHDLLDPEPILDRNMVSNIAQVQSFGIRSFEINEVRLEARLNQDYFCLRICPTSGV